MSNIASLPKIENKGILYIYKLLERKHSFSSLKKRKKFPQIHTYESDIHYCFNFCSKEEKENKQICATNIEYKKPDVTIKSPYLKHTNCH